MNVADPAEAGYRRRPTAALPPGEWHQRPAATGADPGRTGSPCPLYSILLGVIPVNASTTLAIVGHLLPAPHEDGQSRPDPVTPGLVVDRESREARIGATLIELTFREFELLDFLVSNPGKVFRREQLITRVWGDGHENGSRTVDVHVHRLRRKLGTTHGQCLVTMKHVGYKFIPSNAQPGGDAVVDQAGAVSHHGHG